MLKTCLNYSGRFPKGVQKEEIQQWRSRPGEKETLNITLRKNYKTNWNIYDVPSPQKQKRRRRNVKCWFVWVAFLEPYWFIKKWAVEKVLGCFWFVLYWKLFFEWSHEIQRLFYIYIYIYIWPYFKKYLRVVGEIPKHRKSKKWDSICKEYKSRKVKQITYQIIYKMIYNIRQTTAMNIILQ